MTKVKSKKKQVDQSARFREAVKEVGGDAGAFENDH
jgi:hypothetical protein